MNPKVVSNTVVGLNGFGVVDDEQVGRGLIWSARAGIDKVAETVLGDAGAPALGPPAGQQIGLAEALIDLDIELILFRQARSR